MQVGLKIWRYDAMMDAFLRDRVFRISEIDP